MTLLAAIPTELAAGRFAVPAWVIVALGVTVVVGAGVYLSARLRRARSKDRNPG